MSAASAIREHPVPAAADATAGAIYTPGRYFTDGPSLYRIVGWLNRPVGPDLVEVEECLSLDRVLVRVDELIRLRLEPVRSDADADLRPA